MRRPWLRQRSGLKGFVRSDVSLCASIAACVCGLFFVLVPASAQAGTGLGIVSQFGGAQLTTPDAIAVDDSTGNVFVDDLGTNHVLAFSSSGVYLPQLSLDGSSTPAQQFSFADPTGLAVDNSSGPSGGDLYVVDGGADVVDKFSASGAYLSQITGPTTGSTFDSVAGVAVDPSGNLWVADRLGGGVYEFDDAGNLISHFQDGYGQTIAIAVDGLGDVYLVRGIPVVEKWTPAAQSAGPGSGVQVDPGPASAIAADDATNELYVDDGTDVAEYTSAGVSLSQAAMAGSTPSNGVAVNDTTGEVYASNGTNHDVNVLGPVTIADVATTPATGVTPVAATLTGTINPNGTDATYYFEYGTDTTYGTVIPAAVADAGSGTSPVSVTAALAGLAPNTTYHYQLVVNSGGSIVFGGDQSFTTSAAPTVVTTGGATGITVTGATVQGTINPMGLDTQYHFDYGTSTNYGNAAPSPDAEVGSDSTTHSETQTLTGLQPGTTYHYRIVAVINGGDVYGPDQTVTTGLALTVVTTGTSTDVTPVSATLTGSINPMGLDTQYHFEYGTDTTYGTDVPAPDAEVGSDSAVHDLSQALTDLQPDTTYHYRLDGVVDGYVVDGPDQTFATGLAPTVVTTGTSTDVTPVSTTLTGSINPMGVDTQYHFEYGTDTTYGMDVPAPDAEVGSDSAVHDLSQALTDLQPDTTYHYRLDGVVDGYPVAGADQTFTTGSLATVVTTGGATGITVSSATLQGTINPMGLDTQYYFDYGTTTNYGNDQPGSPAEVGSDSTAHSETQTLTGLVPGTTYHYRIIAVIGIAYVYGPDQTFTTVALPTVVRTGGAAVSQRAVTVTGSINPMGLATSYHFEYGQDTSYGSQVPVFPDIGVGSDHRSHSVSQTIVGPFLTPGVTWHYRLVATVDGFSVDGPDRTFATPAHGPLDSRVINVLKAPYSAAGDGQTNDATAIQDALNRASAEHGGIVLLPAGHTFLTSDLVMPSNSTLDVEGTVLEDPNLADYNNTSSALGGLPPFGVPDPLILSLYTHDVVLEGHGLIQLQGVPVVPIGFSHVTNFALRYFHETGAVDDGLVFTWLESDQHGIVQGIRMDNANGDIDGLAAVNNSYVRITGNYLNSTDISLEVDVDYGFQTLHTGWLTDPVAETSSHMEVDHNFIDAGLPWDPAFGTIPAGNAFAYPGTPCTANCFADQSKVQMSDYYVHDNHFAGPSAYDCFCGPPGSIPMQSPATRLHFWDNTYDGAFYPLYGPLTATDSHFDTPLFDTAKGGSIATEFQNPSFAPVTIGSLTAPEGDAWWTTVGNAGATTDSTPPAVPQYGTGTTWAGYVLGDRSGPSELFQGLELQPGNYTFSVNARVHGQAVLFARDTCTGAILAQKRLTTSGWQTQTLPITESTFCQDVQIGVRVAGRNRWAHTVDWAMINTANLISPTAATSNVRKAQTRRHTRARSRAPHPTYNLP